MNKKNLFILLFSLVLLVHAFAAEKIYLFQSDIKIEQNGDLVIEEKIKVKAEGVRIKRGIFRAIPNTYKTKNGLKFKVDLEVLEIRKDGVSESFHIKNQNGITTIYIGNKDVFLSEGDYTYTIKYRTSNQIGFYEEFDELFWNVNGTQWEFPIEKVVANVYLPIGARVLQHAAYTGYFGEDRKDFKLLKKETNFVSLETTKTLYAEENFSVAVAWQKGIIPQPSATDKFLKLLKDNLFLLFGILGTLLAFLIHLLNWKKVGVDPEKGTIIPLFKPMSGLSPSAMRYILKMDMDDKTFTAAVVSMATKGALKIEKKKKVYYLIKEGKADLSKLSESEKVLFKSIFSANDLLKISNTNHSKIRNAQTKFYKKEKELHQETYFKLNRKYLTGGLALSVLTIVAMFLAVGMDFRFESFIPFLPIMFFVFIMFKSFPTFGKNVIGLVIAAAFFGIFFFLPFLGTIGLGIFQIVAIIAVICILLFINFLFAYLMKAPTLFGRKEMDKIEGFKMYLKTAEEQRLNAQNIPDKTPQLFEAYLPYAIALDCENQWAKKFEDVLQSAIDAGSYVQPTWYIGGNGKPFSPGSLTNDIGGKLNNAMTSAALPPSQRGSSSGGGFSGGSSGGGFSGGGGGGGGGGGW